MNKEDKVIFLLVTFLFLVLVFGVWFSYQERGVLFSPYLDDSDFATREEYCKNRYSNNDQTYLRCVFRGNTVCVDSDDGVKYYDKGEVTVSFLTCDGTGFDSLNPNCIDLFSVSDECLNNNVLSELYCKSDGSFDIRERKCPRGCFDGACLRK